MSSIPFLEAKTTLDGIQTKGVCPYCHKMHFHGGYGHRVAHCNPEKMRQYGIDISRGYNVIPAITKKK